jgi:hypothetical protein
MLGQTYIYYPFGSKVYQRNSPRMLSYILVALVVLSAPFILAHPMEPTQTTQVEVRRPAAKAPPNCFPAIGFTMPSTVPTSLTNWWCAYNTEYGFVGFSYEVTECGLYFSLFCGF